MYSLLNVWARSVSSYQRCFQFSIKTSLFLTNNTFSRPLEVSNKRRIVFSTRLVERLASREITKFGYTCARLGQYDSLRSYITVLISCSMLDTAHLSMAHGLLIFRGDDAFYYILLPLCNVKETRGRDCRYTCILHVFIGSISVNNFFFFNISGIFKTFL